jgi:tRNA pseudouridine38-40 synthase
VQSVLYTALCSLPFSCSNLQAAGRTDAGVHATGQVVAFSYKKNSIPVEKFPHILNPKLPYDLQIRSSHRVALDFDPRRHASSRLYCYRIATRAILLPSTRNITIIRHGLALHQLNILAGLFVGRHNFKAFCSTKDINKSKVREIYSAHFVMIQGIVHFYIEGNAFLMNMVRRIVGTLIEPISFEANYKRIQEALISQDSRHSGATALANGLTLEWVEYQKQ